MIVQSLKNNVIAQNNKFNNNFKAVNSSKESLTNGTGFLSYRQAVALKSQRIAFCRTTPQIQTALKTAREALGVLERSEPITKAFIKSLDTLASKGVKVKTIA